MKIFFPLLILFLGVNALAQGLDLGEGISVSPEQLEAFKKELPRTTQDRTFYHWTSKSNAMRWVTQKHINAGEMEFLNKPSATLQVYGPGFYIAEDPTTSKISEKRQFPLS